MGKWEMGNKTMRTYRTADQMANQVLPRVELQRGQRGEGSYEKSEINDNNKI